MDLEILKNAQIIKEKSDDYPNWIYYDDKGNMKVNASMLGYEVMEEIPMIRVSSFVQGARFDKHAGAWRMDKLSDFLDSYITEKLENVGKWSQQKLAEVKKFIMIKIYDGQIKENPFDKSKPYLVNFKNGTYNTKEKTLKLHNPKDYIFQSHPYNLRIDESSKVIPVKTIAWLKDLTSDADSVTYLMEMIGYCFYRSYEPFQMITILQGAGGNGKSSFLNHLTKMIGSMNISNATLQDLGNKSNRFASSQLYQKEANIFADIDSEFINSTGLVKALTGMDSLFAEFKGQDPFMFQNFAKLIFSANELPAFSDFSVGFERRLYVVPFPNVIDAEFKKKHDLKAIGKEIPVFVYYCLNAFNTARIKEKLTVSKSMSSAKEKWLKESNHIIRFIEDFCEIDTNVNTGDSSRRIYEKYQDFCFQENIRALSQPKFSRQLEKMGIFRKKQSIEGTRIWRYIHLILKDNFNT